jgi:hypothetical protein
LAVHGVRLSDELNEEVVLQPHHVRDEFWKAHDHLARLAAPGPARLGQLELPLLTGSASARRTHPFGKHGWIVYRRVADCEIEILDVHWPTECDRDEVGHAAGPVQR